MTLEINGRLDPSLNFLKFAESRLLFLSNGRICAALRLWGIKPVARERFTISVITGVNTDSQTRLQYSAGTGSRSQLFTWKVIRSDIFFDDTGRKFVNSCELSSQQISKVADGVSEITRAPMESIYLRRNSWNFKQVLDRRKLMENEQHLYGSREITRRSNAFLKRVSVAILTGNNEDRS